MRRAWILTAAIAGSACSTEPSFDTGSAASTGVTGTGVTSSVSGSTGAQAISASSAGGSGPSGTGGEGGVGATGGGTPGSGGAGGAEQGSGGTGGGPPSTCHNGNIEAGEDCDSVSGLCVDCRLECPTGWSLSPSRTRCFLFDATPLSFFDAASRCATMDANGARARLATPRTPDDLAAAASLCDGEPCWIGLSDLQLEATFVWMDGVEAELEPGQPPWLPGQPDDLTQQDCVVVQGTDEGIVGLDDGGCALTAPSLCEALPGWAESALCEDNTNVDPGEECQGNDALCVGCDRVCNDDGFNQWREAPFGTHTCYLTTDATSPADVAATFCTDQGGRLATPDELGDISVARDVCGGTCWLGGNDNAIEGAFVWDSLEAFTYENGTPPWGAGQPGGGATENCMILTSGTIHDYPCTTSDARPLCERAD